MPIHDLGYREWNGHLTSASSRWKVIAETGAGRVWKSGWVRRILFFAWLPLLIFAAVFVLYERAAHGDEAWQRAVIGLSQSIDEVGDKLSLATSDPTQALNDNRHTAWSLILHYYFRYPQGVAMVLLIGLIAPRLISEDVQTRAFLFYFSRPLSRLEYLLGKSVTVWIFIAGITTLPALMMYLVGIAMSPSVDVVLDTWDIPLRILLASVTVIVPATAIALCLSSLTKESRYAGFAWFALWVLGMVSYIFIGGYRTVGGGDIERIQENAETVVLTADTDNDGLTTRAELKKMIEQRLQEPGGANRLQWAFRRQPKQFNSDAVVNAIFVADLDRDGAISEADLDAEVHYFEEYLSIYHTFGAVQRWIFGLETFNEVKYFLLSLLIVTSLCLVVLFRRISAPMRA